MNIPITEIIEYARLAPSVHNVQPWRFTVTQSTISLFVEPTRVLDEGDPTRRELWVSLGICLEAIIQSANGLGFDTIIESQQTDSTTDEIARMHFTPKPEKNPEIIAAIKNRHSYRDHMVPVPIPGSFMQQCQQSIADLPDISIIFVDDKKTIAQVADITDKGMQLALSSSNFRKELAELLHYNWSKARTGLHGYAFNHGLFGSIWEKWSVILGLDNKGKARADRQRVLESSGLFFLLAKGDVPRFWFDVGRAYMRIALEITKAGLAHSTLTAPVEAARFHEDIERTLQTTDRIQSMIRIGKATRPVHRFSPRLSVEELTT